MIALRRSCGKLPFPQQAANKSDSFLWRVSPPSLYTSAGIPSIPGNLWHLSLVMAALISSIVGEIVKFSPDHLLWYFP